MALPADLLDRLPPQLHHSGLLRLGTGPLKPSLVQTSALKLGLGPVSSAEQVPEEELDWKQRLEQGQLLTGGVVELCCDGGLALGTSIALRACVRVQEETKKLSGSSAWCAFVDPTGSLYAPGVQAAGVDLSRLLVVRPDKESLSRVALRLAESRVFPLVVVDLMGMPGAEVEPQLGAWVRVVRRLSLAVNSSARGVVLLTDKNAPRPLPLPVSQRIMLSRTSVRQLDIHVSKDQRGGPLRKASMRWERRQNVG